jgi:apolipoprotein N-acyltransferase
MALKPKENKTLLAMVAVMASAVLLFWGMGLHPHWWLMWLAPLPVLLIAARVSAKAAFGAATLAWFLGGMNVWRYYVSVGDPTKSGVTAWILPFVAMLVPACIFGLSVLLWRALLRRGALRMAVLAFPAVWVAYEYILTFLWPHGTWGSLAYTQMDFVPFIQLASLTGVWGVSFFLLLVPGAIAAISADYGIRIEKRNIAIVTGLIFAAVLGFGWTRLHFTPTPERTVVVGLIASDTRENVYPQEPEQTARLMRDYLEQVKDLAAQGAKVIVLPEKLGVVVDPKGTAEIDSMLETAARETGTEIVVGFIRRSATAKLNEARVYSGSDLAPLFYEKEHMLPAFESSFLPGTERVSFSKPSGKWGVAICKDMDFPKLSRQYGTDDVGLMLVPAWDFGEDGWLHSRMAIMRGVESGFSIARAPKQGMLTVSDSRGRVLAERKTSSDKFATLVASVPVQNDTTLYRRFGDWFAWISLAGLAGLLASGLRGFRIPASQAEFTRQRL